MTEALTDQQLAEITTRHARSSNSGAWRTAEEADAIADRGRLLTDNARLRAELEQTRAALAEASCPLTCPCRSTPLPARWDKTVVPPNPEDAEDTDTLVCCIADNGQPIALWLDAGQRETLGLMLIYPGEMDLTPACSCHAERVHQAGCPAT